MASLATAKAEVGAVAKAAQKNCVEQTVKNKIKKMTYLHVYFKKFGIPKFCKFELFGWQDLIGIFRGIVGLCMGFSLLSAAEFIYFFTIRLWVEAKKNMKQKSQRKLEYIRSEHHNQ